MSKTVKPGTDFYRACNDLWTRTTSLPTYRNTYGVSEELEDYLEEYLFEIARAAARVAAKGLPTKTAEDGAEDAIGRLVLSSIRPEKQARNVETLKVALRSAGCMRDTADVASMIGGMIRLGIPTLLSVGVDTTFDGGDLRQTLLIEPGTLGLPDPHYYLETAETPSPLKSNVVLKAYREFLEFLGDQFDLGFNLADAISSEAAMAEPLVAAQKETEIVMAPSTDLPKKFPAIPWPTLFAAIGFTEKTMPKRVGVIGAEWLSVVNSFFQDLPMAGWKALLSLHTAVHGVQFLPAPFDQRHYEFYGRMLQGQKEKIPQHVLTMNVLRSGMSEYMSYFFIKKHLDPAEKGRATIFVKNLFHAVERRLKGTEWLEPKSREALVKKVQAMTHSIFYPEPVKPPKEIPALQTDAFLTNVYLLNAAATDREIGRLLTQPNPGKRWDEPVYTVNAYYYQETNQIVLPAGYFFWPFYDSKRLGWSYGGLGAIIAHEIVHAFDEEGKEINEKGERKPLWSTKDGKEYGKRLSAIIELYNRAKVGGVHVNGVLTASENLADLGGLAIALDALEQQLRGRPAAERLKELREFFWSYAVSWRTKVREKKAVQSIFMDKHAPPEFRVNYVVSQLDAWYEAFGVETGDTLYVAPEDRLRIF